MSKKEQGENELKRNEKVIKVARDEDLLEQIGRNIWFDLVDHDKVRSFRIKKKMRFKFFKEAVAKEFGIPVQFQRFWLWGKRQNHTFRPRRPLTSEEESLCVGQLIEVSNETNNAELKLFLEVEFGQDLRPISPPLKRKKDILLFFKLYDPVKEELRYVGRLFVNANGRPVEILTKLNEMAGFAADEEITLFEEIKFQPSVMCEPVDKMFTFRGSQLENGDIICYQKSSQVETCEQFRYPDVRSFLENVCHHQATGHVGLGNQGTVQVNHQDESQHPFPKNNSQDLAYTEAPNVVKEEECVPSESTSRTSCNGIPPPQALRPTSGTQAHPVNASLLDNIVRSEDATPAGKVRFLSYWVSSEASFLLERIHGLHEDTFTNFSMKGGPMQTGVLEVFASFIESMSTNKVNEVEALSRAVISLQDFEQVGLDLSWLKQRLDEAKRVNKCSDSVVFMELCASNLEVARARVRELHEGLIKAKAEVEVRLRELPNSLGVDDYILKDVV
ncbi:ubiquitin C-terminal hydrolase 13-like [Actinidia eriantha]|uniref:ubiquitin C-terminal hydrolase 13-like n=1 Tax=Actinidia eriantha TaxID=165200 RepID=UPI002587CBA7|nr:ubiquitin C-terminal hydrolase 13-like [Actinidia eriantha]